MRHSQKGSDESERVRHSLRSEQRVKGEPGESLYSSARDRPGDPGDNRACSGKRSHAPRARPEDARDDRGAAAEGFEQGRKRGLAAERCRRGTPQVAARRRGRDKPPVLVVEDLPGRATSELAARAARRGRSHGLFVVSSDRRKRPNDLLDRDLEASDDARVAASREQLGIGVASRHPRIYVFGVGDDVREAPGTDREDLSGFLGGVAERV